MIYPISFDNYATITSFLSILPNTRVSSVVEFRFTSHFFLERNKLCYVNVFHVLGFIIDKLRDKLKLFVKMIFFMGNTLSALLPWTFFSVTRYICYILPQSFYLIELYSRWFLVLQYFLATREAKFDAVHCHFKMMGRRLLGIFSQYHRLKLIL